jgi:ribosomal protein S18 acetylase RimI-like enzyme
MTDPDPDREHTITSQTHFSASELQQLAQLLIDAVAAGGGVSFLHPLQPERAAAFWAKAVASAARGERQILVAKSAQGRIDGSVQLITEMPDNQPHRADVAKLLVHSRAKRRGLGSALMQSLETLALQLNKGVLVLDTETGGNAFGLYTKLGWRHAGDIPEFALGSHSGLSATSFFYKHLPSLLISKLNPMSIDAQQLLNASTAFARSLYPDDSNHMLSASELAAQNVYFLGGRVNGELLACAGVALCSDDSDYGLIRSVWVEPKARGKQFGRWMMQALHTHLRQQGVMLARLETGIYQPEAIALYQSLGYSVRGRFGTYMDDPSSVFMEAGLP